MNIFKTKIWLSLFGILWTCNSLAAQHDGARDAVRLVNQGRFDKVESTLVNKKPFAGDSENQFVVMLSLIEQGDLSGAFEAAKKAHELGLPAERFLAGPRSQLEKLSELPEFSKWLEEQQPSRLVHGPLLGNMTANSVDLWVRTSGVQKVVLKVTEADVEEGQAIDGKSGTRDFEETSKAELDYTAVIALKELNAATTYEYQVLIEDGVVSRGRFRTFPESRKPARFTVGFGGGAGFVPEWESMWDTIRSFHPDAFLMLGDNVYIDDPESEATQRYCYARRQSRPEWRRLTSSVPIFSIWDDHDFGTNDCIPGADPEKPLWKRKVWEVFQENWVNPAYGGGEEAPGCWYSFTIGDVEFFMLDGRYYRDLEQGSMLGSVQKEWLLKSLSESNATFKVIASPVPFTSGIKRGSKDPWDGFPEEREEIFSHLETEKIEGVFLVAADRHRTDLRKINRPEGYDLYEFESSRLTNHHTHPVVATEGLIWGYNRTCSFALMTFDTTNDNPRVTFRCVDLEGNVQHTYELKLSELRFGN